MIHECPEYGYAAGVWREFSSSIMCLDEESPRRRSSELLEATLVPRNGMAWKGVPHPEREGGGHGAQISSNALAPTTNTSIRDKMTHDAITAVHFGHPSPPQPMQKRDTPRFDAT